MNDKLKQFIDNIGIICEVWVISYNSFVQRGLSHKAALDHTGAFMTTFMDSAIRNGGNKE